jgi:hypothetical protein
MRLIAALGDNRMDLHKQKMDRRGIIFTMDATLAIIVAFVVIAAARTQMQSAELPYTQQLYSQKMADDLIAVLGEAGVLETLNSTAIYGNLTAILPDSYNMSATIYSYSYGSGAFSLAENLTIGGSPQTEDRVVQGKSVFVSGSDFVSRYNLIIYKIWPRS